VYSAIEKVNKLESNKCTEALILKGKLLHRKEDFKMAILVLDEAMQLQAEDD